MIFWKGQNFADNEKISGCLKIMEEGGRKEGRQNTEEF